MNVEHRRSNIQLPTMPRRDTLNENRKRSNIIQSIFEIGFLTIVAKDALCRHIGLKLVLLLFFTLSLGMPLLNESSWADMKTLPFSPGEKLTFRVRWAFITAGEARLEVRPLKTVNGIRAYHFVLTARTHPAVDLIYKVRDKIEGYTDDKMSHSILYREMKEGKSKKKVVIDFDWEKGEAHRQTNGKMAAPIPLKPGAFDMLSIYYAFRTHELKEGLEFAVPVTDGEKCVMGRAKVIKRENKKVPAGTYDVFLVEPDLEHIGGVFKRSKDAKLQIWVTADHRKIPVILKSKVAVGSFVAKLVSIENSALPPKETIDTIPQ